MGGDTLAAIAVEMNCVLVCVDGMANETAGLFVFCHVSLGLLLCAGGTPDTANTHTTLLHLMSL